MPLPGGGLRFSQAENARLSRTWAQGKLTTRQVRASVLLIFQSAGTLGFSMIFMAAKTALHFLMRYATQPPKTTDTLARSLCSGLSTPGQR